MVRKKVLVLASTFPRWANDTTPPFVYELERRMSTQFDIFLLAPHFHGAKKKESIENMKIRRFQYFWPSSLQKLCYEGGILPNLKKNKLLYLEAFLLIFFELIEAIKIIKKEKIDLIHAHWIIPQGLVALVIKKIFHVPYVVTTHGGDIYGLQSNILRFVKKTVLLNAKKITVVSTAIKKELLQTIDTTLPIDVISMGVDGKLFHPDRFDAEIKTKYHIEGPFLLFVGRLAEKKGVAYLLQAMPSIIEAFPKVKLLIVGEGAIKEELERLDEFLGISKNVIFVGGLPNTELPKYYATADLFIGPSIQTEDGDTEGLGLTFVEASLSGSIPIGTRVGGIADVIQHNQTGFLVKEKNAQEIAHMVISLLKNRHLMTKIKHKARESAIKKFDWGNISLQYSQIYAYK